MEWPSQFARNRSLPGPGHSFGSASRDPSAIFRNVLGSPGARSHEHGRGLSPSLLPPDRQANISGFARQLRGGNSYSGGRDSFRSYSPYSGRDDFYGGSGGYGAHHWDHARPRHPRHSFCNRALFYSSWDLVPEILWASASLNYMYLDPLVGPDVYGSSYPIGSSYPSGSGYELAYTVDPSSELSREDILFRKGSTDFADRASGQIVEDLAYALMDPSLAGMRFVIEGHASAEGSPEANLVLSQRRAERIAQEVVALGVDPQRIVPIGYGETEARYPGNASEELRRLDRRVVVYRLEENPNPQP